jgi:hypothetical protein
LLTGSIVDADFACNSFGLGHGFLPMDYPYSRTKIVPLDRKKMPGHFPGADRGALSRLFTTHFHSSFPLNYFSHTRFFIKRQQPTGICRTSTFDRPILLFFIWYLQTKLEVPLLYLM